VVLKADNSVSFVMKRNKKLAPNSELLAEIIIDGQNLDMIPSKSAVEAVLLHHMVNCNKYFSSASNESKFYSNLPICREKDRDDLMVDIPVAAFKKFEAWVKDRMHWQAERHRYLGFFTTFSGLETFDLAGKTNRAARDGQEMRTARLAKDIVNHKDFDGTIKVDGHLLGMDELRRAVKASARENS